MQEIVQSVDRSLSILEVLSDYEEGLGITDISERVSLHKSTVHRLLSTLIFKGYVDQSEQTNRYRLTLKLFELGNKKVEKMNIITVSKKYLEALMEETNEVVHLVMREGSEVIYVAKVESKNTIRMYSSIGKRNPVYCTAVGKSMLSYMSDEDVKKIWEDSSIKKFTENTIVDFKKFKEHLKLVKKRGYAMDDQEIEIGVRCIGTSIMDHTGEICGAISISGSILSLTEDKIEKFSKIIIEYASKISKELGYKI